MLLPPALTAERIASAVTDLRRFTCRPPAASWRKPPRYVANLERFSRLWWHDIVLGYGLAEEQTDSRPTGRLSVRFYVTRKLPRSRLKSSLRIPRTLRVKSAGGGHVDVPTDVVELRRVPAAHRTVNAGDSMGHFIGLQGTFGLAVRDSTGQPYALTCAHVVAPHFLNPLDAPVESPADFDRVAGPNVMGSVFTWTQLDDAVLNTADAALVKPAAAVTLSNAALKLTPPARFLMLTPRQFAGMRGRPAVVQTHRGALPAVMDSIANDLPFEINGRLFRFTDVASYTASVQPGDSGSAVVDSLSGQVLGLHFAGNRVERTGFCILSSTIVRAFSALGLTVAP